MKKLYLLLLTTLCLASCVSDLDFWNFGSSLPEEIRGTIEQESESRTSMDDFGNIRWMEGDEISFFMGKTINSHYVLSSGAGTTCAGFKLIPPTGPVAGQEIPINVSYYPYQENIVLERNASSVILSVTLPVVQEYAAGSPGNGAFPMVAVTENESDFELKFKNVSSLLKLQLKGDVTVKKIELTGNNNEALCGPAQVTASNGSAPTISLTGEEKTVILDCGAGVKLNPTTATDFYISLPPITLSKGFTIKVYDNVGRYMEKATTKSLTFSRSKCKPLSAFDYVATGEVAADEGSGIYLGIIGFNQKLSSYPIKLLTTNAKLGYYDFIDGLSNNYDGTAIYYAVDQAITTLQESAFPEDLNSVNVITFTDGIDNYSLDIYDEIEFGRYNSPDECGDYVKSRFTNDKVADNAISGFAVGSRHSDVNSTRFTSTLNRIASSPSQVYELSDMAAVEAKFKELATNITEVNKTQNITLSIASGGLATGDPIRFTFDLTSASSSPTASNYYIEGTFERVNATTRKITNITCKGLTMKGTDVIGTKNSATGLFDFKFENIATDNKVLIDAKKTLEWWGSPWQKDTEFNPDANTKTEVLNHSAAIILVLDCTKSLGSKFGEMKTSAKSFISTLLQQAYENGTLEEPTITPNNLSRTPIDLSLAVSYEGERYYMTKEQYNQLGGNVEGSGYSIDGLTVLSAAGNFIVALKNANENYPIYYDAWQLLYQQSNMPTYDQGLIMSARLSEINTALTAFGGKSLSTSSSYGGTGGVTWINLKSDGYYFYLYNGGGVIERSSNPGSCYYRPVIALNEKMTSFCKDNLKLSVLKDGVRKLISLEEYQTTGVPSGYTKEGVYVKFPNLDGFIVELENANTSTVNYSSAVSLYGDYLPTYNQGIAMSAILEKINSVLTSFGGKSLSTSSSYGGTGGYTWINHKSNGYYYDLYNGGGGIERSSNPGSCYVRRVINCGDITEE